MAQGDGELAAGAFDTSVARRVGASGAACLDRDVVGRRRLGQGAVLYGLLVLGSALVQEAVLGEPVAVATAWVVAAMAVSLTLFQSLRRGFRSGFLHSRCSVLLRVWLPAVQRPGGGAMCLAPCPQGVGKGACKGPPGLRQGPACPAVEAALTGSP